MANAIYPKAKEAFLSGAINMTSDTIKIALVDTGTYTYSASHEHYSDLSGVLGTPVALGSKTVTSGVFDAADATFTTPTAGTSIEALVIYKDTGTASNITLVLFGKLYSSVFAVTSPLVIVCVYTNSSYTD